MPKHDSSHAKVARIPCISTGYV